MIDRHNRILKTIELLRTVSVAELKEKLKVSEVTIRKDLTILEDQGLIIRTHGGARMAQDPGSLRTLTIREKENTEYKRAIARKASELVSDGETVFIDSGSTCMAIARELKNRTLRVITNALSILNILAGSETITLHSIGGSYRREAGSFIGPLSLTNLNEYQIETCFVGATGFTQRGIFSSQNIAEGQVKKQILLSSARKIIAADSTKAGKQAFSVFARPGEVDILITDYDLKNQDFIESFLKTGIELIIAEK